jgi:predicted trehalose synthase
VYEVGYELGHRPDQAGIPLAGVARLVRAAASP